MHSFQLFNENLVIVQLVLILVVLHSGPYLLIGSSTDSNGIIKWTSSKSLIHYQQNPRCDSVDLTLVIRVYEMISLRLAH